jgi:hypothetical protein
MPTTIRPAPGVLDARIAKAARLVDDGQIETFSGVDVAFVPGTVPGIMHTVVIVDDEHATCSCRAGQHGIVCAHQLAARHVLAQERP